MAQRILARGTTESVADSRSRSPHSSHPLRGAPWIGDHWAVFGASPEPPPTDKTSARPRTRFIVAGSLALAAAIGLLVLGRIAGEEISWRLIWFVAVFGVVGMLGAFVFFSRAARQGRGIFVEPPLAALGRKERWQVLRRIRRGEAAPDLASAELQQQAASHYLAQRWWYGGLILLALPQVINLVTGKVVGRPLAASFVTTYAVLAGCPRETAEERSNLDGGKSSTLAAVVETARRRPEVPFGVFSVQGVVEAHAPRRSRRSARERPCSWRAPVLWLPATGRRG